jgi:chitodextrinase
LNYAEVNQVEANTAALAAYMQKLQYNIPALSVLSNRDQTFVDTIKSINRLEDNIDALRTSFMTPPGYLTKKLWGVGVRLYYDDPNRWEKNLQNLFDYAVSVQKSMIYCGDVTAGAFTIRANWADGEEQTTIDKVAPTQPAALVLISKTSTKANLSWSPSYDYRGVTEYRVYIDSLLVGSTAGTTLTIAALTPNTQYSMTVQAVDAAGNTSVLSPVLTFTTDALPVDKTIPTPYGLAVVDKTDTTITLSWSDLAAAVAVSVGSSVTASTTTTGYLSWSAVGGVTGYLVSGGPFSVDAVDPTVTISGLMPATSYTFVVQAKGNNGKLSDYSESITVMTNSSQEFLFLSPYQIMIN